MPFEPAPAGSLVVLYSQYEQGTKHEQMQTAIAHLLVSRISHHLEPKLLVSNEYRMMRGNVKRETLKFRAREQTRQMECEALELNVHLDRAHLAGDESEAGGDSGSHRSA